MEHFAHAFYLFLRPDNDRRALINIVNIDIENGFVPVGSGTARFFHNEGERTALEEKAQFSQWIFASANVREDARSFDENVMDIWDHAAGVAERDAFIQPCVHHLPVCRCIHNGSKVSGSVGLHFVTHREVALQEDELPHFVEEKSVDAFSGAIHQRRTGTVDEIERCDLFSWFVSDQIIPFVDAENRADGQIAIHEGRAIERIEYYRERSIRDELLENSFFLGCITVYQPALAQLAFDDFVAQDIELQLLFAKLVR